MLKGVSLAVGVPANTLAGRPSAHLMFKSSSGALTWSGWYLLIIGGWMIVAGIMLGIVGWAPARLRARVSPVFRRVLGLCGVAAGIMLFALVLTSRPGHLD